MLNNFQHSYKYQSCKNRFYSEQWLQPNNILLDEGFSVGFQYVPPNFISYLMSHLCCMATTFATDDSSLYKVVIPVPDPLANYLEVTRSTWGDQLHSFIVAGPPREEVKLVQVPGSWQEWWEITSQVITEYTDYQTCAHLILGIPWVKTIMRSKFSPYLHGLVNSPKNP